MFVHEIEVRESVADLEQRATRETSGSRRQRLTALLIYKTLSETDHTEPVAGAARAVGVEVAELSGWLTAYRELGLQGLFAGASPESSGDARAADARPSRSSTGADGGAGASRGGGAYSHADAYLDDLDSAGVSAHQRRSYTRTRSPHREVNRMSAPQVDVIRDRAILVAETDSMLQSIIRHRLEKEGATVVTTGDGMEAVSRLESDSFDLAIIAASLPGLDGFEVTRWLTGDSASGAVPVLFLSWPGNESDVVHAFDAGADDFLLKPFSPVEFVARVRHLLGTCEREERGEVRHGSG